MPNYAIKIKYIILCTLLIMWSSAFAIDSTGTPVQPSSSLTPANKVTLTVRHMSKIGQDGTWCEVRPRDNSRNPACPTQTFPDGTFIPIAWCPTAQASTGSNFKGMSPVVDASQLAPPTFFPFTNNSLVFTLGDAYGVYAYECAETYWTTDPYYKLLVNNKAVSCNHNDTEWCSIRPSSDLQGYLPVRFNVKRPQQVTTYVGGGGSGHSYVILVKFATPWNDRMSITHYNRIGTAPTYTETLTGGYFNFSSLGDRIDVFMSWRTAWWQMDSGAGAQSWTAGDAALQRNNIELNTLYGRTCELYPVADNWNFFMGQPPAPDRNTVPVVTGMNGALGMQCY